MPKIQTTKKFIEAFEGAQDPSQEVELFKEQFLEWRKLVDKNEEYKSYLFGKDGAYIHPKVNGVEYVLRHVHLVPLEDQAELDKWNRAYSRRSRPSSDRVLVYVEDQTNGFLLIQILPEQSGHDIAKMLNKEDRETMRSFANIADAFIYYNQVIG